MDHPTFLPDPEDLLERGRQVRSLLSEWRLLICTPQRPYGQLLLANLLGSPPEEPSQQLLGYCRRGAEAPALLPTQASDVLILSQEILLDGPALPVLQQLLQRPRAPTVLLSLGLFTLAFLQATPTGGPAWAGLPALSLTSTNPQALAIRNEINQLRAAGGDVMVSMGGASAWLRVSAPPAAVPPHWPPVTAK